MNQGPAPLVSIVTPTYNHQEFIGPCIESVRKQTYSNWEQIIIDDGSSDRTAEVIGRYNDPRIKYIYQSHTGIENLPQSYNRALAASRGELVAILEGDDIWPADKLSNLVPAFDDTGIVLAYGAVGELSADGNWSGRVTRSVRQHRKLPRSSLSNFPIGSATIHILTRNDLVPPSTAIVRRSALEAIGGFQHVPGLCVTDFPTFLRLSLEGRFHYTPEIMGYRRRHLESVTLNNISQISTAAQRHALEFVIRHKLELTSSAHKELEKIRRIGEQSNYFSEARLSLLQKDWKRARTYFLKATAVSQPRLLLASALGWAMSWLHCDLEWAIRFAGRAAIRS